MNTRMIAVLLFGVFLGGVAMHWQSGRSGSGTDVERVDAQEPLYWVAPMDPGYRRDGPGKSPMGMDLVPVYAADTPGVVAIAPEVVNSLGVRSERVRRDVLDDEIRTVGYVRYDEDRLIHIHPRLEGWIETLHVKASGDPVTRDQPLYELYSPHLVTAQEELVLALRRNSAGLLRAAEDRLRALQVSQELIDEVKATRTVRQRVLFRSPQDGVVDNLNVREGFFVGPATTLMSIGALDEVWVEAEVFERQADSVRVGLPVTMTLDFLPGRRWTGQVDYVYPSLDEITRTLRVRLRFPNPQRELRPNMFAQVIIHSGASEPALLVPREAVIRLGQQDRVVLDLGDGRYRSVPVRLGRRGQRMHEVLTGLSEGDRVVISAQFLIDSESSKQADLARMGDSSVGTLQSARVAGRVDNLDVQRRLVTISRDAIEKWGRPPATVTFIVDAGVDLRRLLVGERLDFTFVIQGGEFILTEVHGQLPDEEGAP